MTGTSSAYGMYLLPKLCLNKNIFSPEKWRGGGGSSAVPKDIDKGMPREGKHMDKKDYLKFLGKPKISYINFFQPNQQTQIKQTIKSI